MSFLVSNRLRFLNLSEIRIMNGIFERSIICSSGVSREYYEIVFLFHHLSSGYNQIWSKIKENLFESETKMIFIIRIFRNYFSSVDSIVFLLFFSMYTSRKVETM